MFPCSKLGKKSKAASLHNHNRDAFCLVGMDRVREVPWSENGAGKEIGESRVPPLRENVCRVVGFETAHAAPHRPVLVLVRELQKGVHVQDELQHTFEICAQVHCFLRDGRRRRNDPRWLVDTRPELEETKILLAS